MVTGEKMPQDDVDDFKAMQPAPINPLDIRDAVPTPGAIQAAVMGIPGLFNTAHY